MNNIFKKDVSKLHLLETRFSKKAIACAITLSLGISAFPLCSFAAATLQGHRFIDTSNDGVLNNNESTLDGYIIFKPLNDPALKPFAVRITGGSYSVFLPDGSYNVWQYVDSNTTTLTSPQISTIQWATTLSPTQIATQNPTTNGFNINVSGSTILGASNNTLDFPFPNFSTTTSTIPAEVTNACNSNDTTNRIVICGISANPPSNLSCTHSGSSWIVDSPEFTNKRAFVYGEVTISNSNSSSNLKSVCNHGTLKNEATSGELKIGFTEVFANFTDGKILASNATNATINGSGIVLTQLGDFGMVYSDTNIFFNQGIIKAGDGFAQNVTGWNAGITFDQNTSIGGNIKIEVTNRTFQRGNLLAGRGGDVDFSDCGVAWEWEHSAGIPRSGIDNDPSPLRNFLTPASKGGNLTINSNFFEGGINSSTFAGEGGSPLVNGNSGDICGSTANEIEGAVGGDLNINVGSGIITGAGLKGRSVYVEPDTMNIGKGTTITAEEDVVIFGGDNWVLTIKDLSANAITAGRKIILATGAGGSIDLRGISSQVFKAADKVEIFTDNLLLDAGVTIESLVSAPNGVTRSGAKIIYHATISGSSQFTVKAGETINAQLDLRNAGPKVDTYTLKATTQDGVTVNGLPASATVDGLKSAPLDLSVVMPANLSTESTSITITATSQADPSVVATFELRLNVPQTNCAEPATYDTSTRTVSLSKIDIPLLSPIDGKETGEIAVFSAQLEQVSGVEDFKIKPNSLQFLSFSKAYDPSHARYSFNTGLFSNGGLLKTCVAVPQIIVIPPNTPIYTDPKHYLVTLRQLAVSPDTFHVESVDAANP